MKRSISISLLIAIISSLLFIPFIGRLNLFDWDEINFAESAREMLLTKDYLTVQIFFEPFWEKPPLFIWLQLISMKLFGVNEFAARFPNAICGIFTLVILFNLGRKLVNEKFGLIWSIVYGVSMLPFFYFKSGIIDPLVQIVYFSGHYFLLPHSKGIGEPNKISENYFIGFFYWFGCTYKRTGCDTCFRTYSFNTFIFR